MDELSAAGHMQALLRVAAAERDDGFTGRGDALHDPYAAAVRQLHRDALVVLPARTCTCAACAPRQNLPTARPVLLVLFYSDVPFEVCCHCMRDWPSLQRYRCCLTSSSCVMRCQLLWREVRGEVCFRGDTDLPSGRILGCMQVCRRQGWLQGWGSSQVWGPPLGQSRGSQQALQGSSRCRHRLLLRPSHQCLRNDTAQGSPCAAASLCQVERRQQWDAR